MNASLPKRHVAAAALTVAGGLALMITGWWFVGFEYRADWGRYADSWWWAGELTRALGFLAFGKVGFKVALACVGAAGIVVTKVVARRRRTADTDSGQ